MPNFISEDSIEKAILKRLREQFGFELLNCHTSDADDLNDRSGRSDKREVILEERLKEAAIRLNPGIPETVIDEALTRLTDKRYAMSPIAANREIDGLIRDGIPVVFDNAQRKKEQERVSARPVKKQHQDKYHHKQVSDQLRSHQLETPVDPCAGIRSCLRLPING